jgi:hypothetical protein
MKFDLKLTQPFDWYLKWVATIFIVAAVLCRSVEDMPKIFDVVLSLIGTSLWWWVAVIWKDRSLIVLNTVLCFILANATLRYFI